MEKDEKKAADKLKPTSGLLSEERKIELRKQAADEARKEAEDAEAEVFLAAELKKAKATEAHRRGHVTNEEIVRHRINLGPSAKHVKINGTVYLHGATYDIPKSVFNVIQETEFRTWRHEDARKGETENPYALRDRTVMSGRGSFASGVARA